MGWDGIPEHRNLRGPDPVPGSPMPADPMNGMAMGAAAAHEMFRALHGGGFNERQALYLVACIMQAGIAQHGVEPGIPGWPPEHP